MKASKANIRHAKSLEEVAARLAAVEKKLDQALAILTSPPTKKKPAKQETKEGDGNDQQTT